MDRNRTLSDDLTEVIPSEERMPAIEWLAEQMPGGFFIYRADDSTEMLYVNQATCDIFGCETLEEFRELTSNSFRGMVHPEDYDRIQTSIDDQIADTSNRSHLDYVVYRIIRKDGTVRWVSDYGHFSMLPGYGEVYYVFIWDITDSKLAAEEKERNETLAHALEAAENANIAKTTFLSNMSHEIRTPITAILGMNEMIQREADDSAILDYSENIRKAGVSLLGIISDILDFSKIESGKLELDLEEYNVSSVVTDLYNLVQFRAEAKGLEIKFIIDPDIPSVMVGDEIRVKQIITNLLTNAVKYTEEGSVVFEMNLESIDDGIARIRISVTDTGIGIREDEIDRLFEPFDRLNLKKTRTIEGSGLGLAITSQMLALMDSRLEVKSTYGEGSVFSFVFDQKTADLTPVGEIDFGAAVHAYNGRRRQSSFTAPGMRLLVVDDTPMNLQVIAGLLKRTRMHIDVAVSGTECIEKFGANHYDLVFLDYRMPHMNGIETLQELKKSYPDKFAETPIISLTASAVSGDKEKMLRAGFTDYLAKPVNVDDMESMLIRHLPPDSVVMVEETEDEEGDELSRLPAIILDCIELDARKGIEYCGDADDYIFALDTYSMSIDAKAEQIEKNLQDNDLEAYTINVHSLKSTSQAIGAMSVFEKAKALEQAGKDADVDRLKSETPVLMNEYRNLKGIIKRIVDKYDPDQETASVPLEVVQEERSRMLARALSEAEQANLAKTAFLSNMSHAIRTPMNSIIGLYNIALRRNDLSDEVRDILTQIGSSARQLTSIINDILDIGRIESGHMKLMNDVFSFGEMIEEINTMVEAQCLEKGIEFNCSISGLTADYYIGDVMKIKQMLINILGNAVKYTHASGKVDFNVSETGREGDQATVRFMINDTGDGIDEEYLPKMFEAFPQIYDETTGECGAMGLGMTITKNIVDLMGGKIEVSSTRNVGTRFTITVPLKLCDDNEAGEVLFNPENLYALVVDDDIAACEHARMVLANIGIETDYVQSGEDALSAIETHKSQARPYNLIMIDWKMPDMDGIELTRSVRSRFADDDIMIILTTYNWDEILEEAISAGVDHFIAKPMFGAGVLHELSVAFAAHKNKGVSKAVRKAVSLEGRRVLIAEDVEINAEITRQILKMKGVETDYACNGEEAVSLFENSDVGHYDAILMDIRMPGLSGLEAARRIRSLDRSDAACVPIIALTANAFDDDVRESLGAGMNAHLSKPVEPDALFITLEKLINNK